MQDEDLNAPRSHSAYFGSFFDLMRQSVTEYGSEMALGVFLFSLVVSIRAKSVIEIGRFKGFSTLALASGLKFVDIGWNEPEQHRQRAHEIDYEDLHRPTPRRIYSIDPEFRPEAEAILRSAELLDYVEFLNVDSAKAELDVVADIVFIDGDHTFEGCQHDVDKYVTHHLRPGGYFILHDYFGWFDELGRNQSPVKAVCDELVARTSFEHILIDTWYPSFKVFRKVD